MRKSSMYAPLPKALTDEEFSEIMESDEITLNLYIKNLIIAAVCIYKYEAADAARKLVQDEVFAPTVENPEMQKHLNWQHCPQGKHCIKTKPWQLAQWLCQE